MSHNPPYKSKGRPRTKKETVLSVKHAVSKRGRPRRNTPPPKYKSILVSEEAHRFLKEYCTAKGIKTMRSLMNAIAIALHDSLKSQED
jgi:hypothetical protein